MYDFIYIYIFSLYSFPESIKKPKLPVILSLWLPPHMWGCSIPPPLPTRPQARDLKFCCVTDFDYFMRESGKNLVRKSTSLAKLILRVVFHQISTFSLGGGVSKFKTIEEKGRLLQPCPTVCLSV